MNKEAPPVLLHQKSKQNILNQIRDNKAKRLSRNDTFSILRSDSFCVKRSQRTDEYTPTASHFAGANPFFRQQENGHAKVDGDNHELDQSDFASSSLAWINSSYDPTPKLAFGAPSFDEMEARNGIPRNMNLPPSHPNHMKNMDFSSSFRHVQSTFNPAEAYYKHWGFETSGADNQAPYGGPAMKFGGTSSTPSTTTDQRRFSDANSQFGFRPQLQSRGSIILPQPPHPLRARKSSRFFSQNYKLIESQRASESVNSLASPEKEHRTLLASLKTRISKIFGLAQRSSLSEPNAPAHVSHDQQELRREDKPRKERRIKSVVSQLDEQDPEKEDASLLDLKEDNFYQINIMGDKPRKQTEEEADGDTPIKISTKKEGWIIKADRPWKLVWNAWVGLLSILLAIWLPVSLAFDLGKESYALDWLGHVFFLLDLLLSSRTSMFHPESGELVKDPSSIRQLYFKSWGFFIDLSVALPWWTVLETTGLDFRLIAALKLIRLQPMLIFNFHSENMKLSLKILNLLGYLLLYIHVTACYFYFVAAQDQEWLPWQTRFANSPSTFYEQGLATRYFTSLYTAILILMGNDTNPESDWHVAVVCIFSITGALFIANIFGTITVVVSTLNRKAQKFQDNVDMANTCMANMRLPTSIQQDIREFMMSTHNNLDTQKELDSFMQMVSPSLRNKVTKHIFINAIASNPVLKDSQEAIDFLINDVSTLLYLPEDRIINQGEQGDSLFLIAKGSCSVWVVDHMRQQQFVRHLNQGEHFGEVSILYETPRTATVKSANYCTLASLSKKTFFELCNNFPSIIVRMRERTLDYKDSWKQFKRKVLGEVEYFKEAAASNPFFLDEVQYHLEEEYFEKGSEIVGPDCQLKHIIFIVQGFVDLIVFDHNGDEKVLESLGQGDTIGQYSSLFDETPIFSAFAKTRVRVLTLDQDFFTSNKDAIAGLDDSITACEDIVESNGIPLCDYSRYYKPIRPRYKLQNAIRKARILEQSLLISQQFQLQQKKEKVSAVRRKEDAESTLDLAIYAKKKKRGSILSNSGQAKLPKPRASMKRRASIAHRLPNSGSFKLKSPQIHMKPPAVKARPSLAKPRRITSREQASQTQSREESSSSSSSLSSDSSCNSSSISKAESFGNVQSPQTLKSISSQYSNTGGSYPRRKDSSQLRAKKQKKKQSRVQFEIQPLKSPSKHKRTGPAPAPLQHGPHSKHPPVPVKQTLAHTMASTLPPIQSRPRKASDKRVTIEAQNMDKDLEMYVLSEHSFEESSCSVSASRNQDPIPQVNPAEALGSNLAAENQALPNGYFGSPDAFGALGSRRRLHTGQLGDQFKIQGIFGNDAPRIHQEPVFRGSSKRVDFSNPGGFGVDQTLQMPSRRLTQSSSMSSTAKEISMARQISKRMRNKTRK